VYLYSVKGLLLLYFLFAFNQLFAANEKRLCFYHGQHYEAGKSNKVYLNAEKTFSLRNVRKVNLMNTSEFTYLGLGGIAHLNSQTSVFGLTSSLQIGLAKTRHIWPTLRYTYLLNDPTSPHRLTVGLAYLPFKNCGIAYGFTFNSSQHSVFKLQHQFGVSINLKTKKLGCLGDQKKKKTARSK